jgi:magnesium transporter
LIRSFYYLPDQGVEMIEGIADFDRLAAHEDGVLWVDLCTPTDDESFVLTHDFQFHPLAIEDVISERPRTKMDDYGRYLFLVFHIVDYIGREEGLKATELDLFLTTNNTLVSVHYDDHRMFDYLYQRAERDERLLSRGADFLFHSLIDAAVDNYNAILDTFEYEVDEVEEEVLGESDEDTLRSIFTLRRDLVQLKRIVVPQKEVLYQLARGQTKLISDPLKVYFSDIHDHLVRINDVTDAYRENLISSLEVYYSSVSTKTNEVIKVLTILTAIFIPPTFLVGLWGMNFAHMPELGLEYGYTIAIGAIMFSMIAMIAIFRFKKWF